MNDFRDHNEERRSRWAQRMEQRQADHGHGHIWTGLFLLIVGGLALAKSFGVPMPVWLFTWQMLLIGIGVFIGIRKGFRDGGWFVPIIIGGAFLVNDYVLFGDMRRHIWPLILIILGVFFILRPRRKRWSSCGQKKNAGLTGENINPLNEDEFTADDFIDSTCIFSGSKKVILSKNFKGGDLVNIFGGCEIDLTQADMTSPAIIEVTAIFGGATLIVPANWAIKSEAVTIFGGIGDKRKFMAPSDSSNNKTLVIKGTIIFGGMEIKSY